ncbi:hypothetical protein TSUD_280920 [Trifolium subterraneum]|uniref:DUF7745 domain-containing protein n=1 Tax=Trifolium subterraneum TaxID=3900 RepID=A0A2Z6PLC5_TRISU|nr:hypothetical protein TSUD_280920 [Trifolium subterraneum]
MAPERRNTFSYKFREPATETLKALSDRLTTNARNNFLVKYGSMLSLLDVKIDTTPLVTLAQFYDPPLRCFTFQDFQLAPTLEEFEKILGYNMKDRRFYLGSKDRPTKEEIAAALQISVQEVALEEKGGTEGFPRNVLEAKAQDALAVKNWEVFNDVLALLVYGIVLFPNIDDFIDLSAIRVFLTKNPVPTLLADFYHSLHTRYGKKGTISCCTSLVQIWLMSHMPSKGPFVENRDKLKWWQRMVALAEKDISWYRPNYDNVEIILSCGEFPNVPLVGTKGCINYNPILALRQLGYPMEDKPSDKSLEGFFLKEGAEDTILLRKIRRAWSQVHKKKMGKKNCVAKAPYTQWVRERVKIIKLPFVVKDPVEPLPPEPITTVPIEVAEGLRNQIAKLQFENEELQSKYFQALGDIARLTRDQEKKEESLRDSRKRLKVSEDKRGIIGDGLLSANENLSAKDEEVKRLERIIQKWKERADEASATQRTWRLKHEELTQKIQKITGEYKEKLQAENLRSQEFERFYLQEKWKCEHLQADLRKQEEQAEQQARLHEVQIAKQNKSLRDMHAELNQYKKVKLSNTTIDKLPEKLKKIEAAMPFYTAPKDVVDFMEYCKKRVKKYKKEIRKRMAS